MKKLFFIGILLITTLFFSCKKNDSGSPSTGVDFHINITLPNYAALNAIGGWVYYDAQGLRGIIIYRKTSTEFMAYERNCTYQPSNSCAQVQVQISGITAIDSCCGSKFLMADGSVYSPPATIALTKYQTTFDAGSSDLHVFN